MKRFVWVGVMLMVAVCLWFWSTEATKIERAPANTEQVVPPSEVQRGARPPGTFDAGTVAKAARPLAPELLPLDCDAPSGDIVSVDGAGIRASDFCERYRLLAGPIAGGDPSVMEREGRALLERMIDALLIERALSQAGQRVSDTEIDAELERVFRDVHAANPKSSRGDIAAMLRDQGIGLKTVREDTAQRLALRKLVELKGSTEPNEAEIAGTYNEDPTRFGATRPLAEVREQVIALIKSRGEVGEQKRILSELRAQSKIVHLQW